VGNGPKDPLYSNEPEATGPVDLAAVLKNTTAVAEVDAGR
jgi:hypothetical protein